MRLNCKYELISGDVLATLSAQILPDKNIKNKAIRFRGKFITIESDKQIVEEAIKTQLHKSAALARLKTSEIGNFNSIDQQVLFARQAMFVSTGENSLSMRIAGMEPSMGKVLIIKNTNNPNYLQIRTDENLLQSSVDGGVCAA